MLQQTSNRTLLMGLMIQGAALVVVVVLLVVGLTRLKDQSARISSDENTSACTIDALEARLGAYVHGFQRHGVRIPPLNLSPVPCVASRRRP